MLIAAKQQVLCATKEYTLNSVPDTLVAGTKLILTLEATNNTLPFLFLKNSYGNTLVEAKTDDGQIKFHVPEFFTKKAGLLSWELVLKEFPLQSGEINILPDRNSKPVMENYFGPRQLQAGNDDFSMLVCIPTDTLDNPLPDNTKIQVRQQFENRIDSDEITTSKLMAWENIYAREKTGIILVSADCNNTQSKEMQADISANIPTNYKIQYSRNHDYADGNQITTFTTSKITDRFGNTVADGTLVEFNIENSKSVQLKTYGATINGVASAQMLHPEFPCIWTVKSYINGFAESNETSLVFEATISDFDVKFKDGNRKIIVGPLKSFIDQIIPDGVRVKLSITKEGAKSEIKNEASKNGYATFTLDSDFYKSGNYTIEVQAMGITKEFKQLKLDE